MPIKPDNGPDPSERLTSTLKTAADVFQRLGIPFQRPSAEEIARFAREQQDAAARREELERERREHDRREREDPRFVVTMVHGTFASRARWILPDEPFGRSLRAAAPTWIEPFVWSGRNTLGARTDAAKALRAHLQQLLERFPRAHHAVVAHSHGGNVALMALADEALAKRMLGVVTLGTPFLSARVIEDDPPLGLAEQLAAAIFSGFAVFAVGAALGYGRSWWTWGFLTIVGMGVFFALANRATSAMQRYARHVEASMPRTRLEPSQLAIVRTSSDEAAAVLSGARVAGGLATLFWNLSGGRLVAALSGLLTRMDYFHIRSFEEQLDASWRKTGERSGSPAPDRQPNAWSQIMGVLPILVLSLLDDQSAAARWLGVAVVVAFGLPAILAFLLGVVAVPFGALFALGRLPSGWGLPLAGPYLDLTAEPVPPGTWTVTQLSSPVHDELSHGRSHDDPEVFAFVASWLQERAAAVERQRGAPGDDPHTRSSEFASSPADHLDR